MQEEIPRVGAIFEIRFNKPKVNAIEHAMNRELGEAFNRMNDFHPNQM